MKKLIKHGIAAIDFENKYQALSYTYTKGDGTTISTPLISKFSPYNKEILNAKVILEIGCGVGRNVFWIMKNTKAHYIGIDPNESMLKYFKETVPKKYMDRITLLNNFPNNKIKVDVVVSTFVFQHIGFRPKDNVMNVEDITREIKNYTNKNTIWFLLEHQREEQWLDKWLKAFDIEKPDVHIKDWKEYKDLCERGNHDLIIIKGL